MQGALRFNGGGHINHSIFWNNLSKDGGGVPSGKSKIMSFSTIILSRNISTVFPTLYENDHITESSPALTIGLQLILS